MKNLSIVQEYLICAVNDKGKISDFSTEKLVCLVAGALLEMLLEDAIILEDKKVRVAGVLPQEKTYLKPLYDYIHQKGTVKVTKLLEDYNFTFTDKRLNELMGTIGDSLDEMGIVEAADAGLLGNKKRYTPKKEVITAVIEKVRAEFLEGDQVTEDIAVLVILLDKSKCLKNYFYKFEQKELMGNITKLTDSPTGQCIKKMIDYIEALTIILFVAAI